MENNLGLSVLLDGTPIYFGGKTHDEGFRNYVEDNDYFKKLKLKFESDDNIFQKAPIIAAQGIITLCVTGGSDGTALLYSPDKLTNNQIKIMKRVIEDYLIMMKMVVIGVFSHDGKYQHFTLDEYVNWCLENNEVHLKK